MGGKVARAVARLKIGDTNEHDCGRAGNNIEFHGRTNRSQKFAVLSFPGVHATEWTQCTQGEQALRKEQRLAIACVFFPDSDSEFYGVHMTKCQCDKLYRNTHPDWETWTDGRAPWGCKWFGKWMTNVDDAIDFLQAGVIVYKRGLAGDRVNGLGYSQRGEVAYLKRFGLALFEVDIEDFMKYILPLARTQKGEMDIGERDPARMCIEMHQALENARANLRVQHRALLDTWREVEQNQQEVKDLEGDVAAARDKKQHLKKQIADLQQQVDRQCETIQACSSGITQAKDKAHSAMTRAKNMLAEWKRQGYSALELRKAGVSAVQLKQAGFTITEMRAAFTAAALRDAGFSASQLKKAGCSTRDLKAAGFTAYDLTNAGVPGKEMRGAGFSAKHMKDAGYAALELRTFGYSMSELKRGGFSFFDLEAAGFEVAGEGRFPLASLIVAVVGALVVSCFNRKHATMWM